MLMIPLNIDLNLQKKLEYFASKNNTDLETLIETILYEYIDEVEEKEGPIAILAEDEEDDYNLGDIEYLEKALGFSKKKND